MANQSTRPFRRHWGSFSSSAELPNTAGAALQNNNLVVGDTAYDLTTPALWVCTGATWQSAVWAQIQITTPTGSGPVRLVDTTGAVTFFNTITAALAAASAGDSVIVANGTYAESVTIPSGVSLRSETYLASTISGAVVGSGVRVTLGTGSILDGFVIIPATNADPGIAFPTVGAGQSTARNLAIGGGAAGTSIGIQLNNATWRVLIDNVILGPGLAGTGLAQGVDVLGGNMVLQDISAISGTITDVVRVANSTVLIRSLRPAVAGVAITDLIEVGAGGVCQCIDVVSRGTVSVAAIHVTSDTATVDARGLLCSSAGDAPLLVDPGVTLATVSLDGNFCENVISVPQAWLAAADHILSFRSKETNNLGFKVWGDFAVGTPEEGTDAALGEGGSYTRGMIVWQATGGGAVADGANFVDVTAEARSASGSTFGFTTGGLNDVLYFASTLEDTPTVRHFGLELAITAAMVGGTVIAEIWDGAAWMQVNIMGSDDIAPHAVFGADILRAVTTENVRYGVLTAPMLRDVSSTISPTTWATKTVNGVGPHYWARLRVTSAPSTPPTFQQAKLHPSHWKVSKTAFREAFGESRTIAQQQFHQRLADDLSGSSPGNATIAFASTLSLGLQGNNFAFNTADGFGLIYYVPPDVDTSLPLIVRLGYIPSNTDTGNIKFDFQYRVITEGDVLSAAGSLTGSGSLLVAGSGVQDQLAFLDLEIDLSAGLSGVSYFAGSIARDGGDATDTFTGSVEVVLFQGFAFPWTS